MNTATPVAAPAAPQLVQYSVDWNNVALQAITAGLDEVPVIGGILSHLVEAFWPESGVDVWAEVRDKVKALVDQAVSDAVFDGALAKLGDVTDESGLIGVLNNYLGSLSKENNNGQDPKQTWTSSNTAFIDAEGTFQEKPYQLLLLPLFAQFANMHLSLLRDGVAKGWVAVSELQDRINLYTGYVDTVFSSGQSDRIKANTGANAGFNFLNVFNRGMQTSVLNFRATWPYFDPSKFPPPVQSIVIDAEIYYTITETLNYPGGTYNLPATPSDPIGSVAVFYLQDYCDNYNLFMGTQVTYTQSGQQPYTGVLIDGGTPPTSRPCNPNNDSVCYFQQSFGVSAGNPIVSVQGAYNTTGGTYCASFTFQDGSSTGEIPSPANQDYAHSYNITAPGGYTLSSLWAPPKAFYYGSAPDVVFGYRVNPMNINQATAKALYLSSLNPVSLESPRYAPFAAVALAENWEAQRKATLERRVIASKK